MNLNELYHFLFETYEGIGLSIVVCLVICVLLCIIMEHRTRKKFRNRPKTEDSFDLFTEIDDEDEDEDESGRKK